MPVSAGKARGTAAGQRPLSGPLSSRFMWSATARSVPVGSLSGAAKPLAAASPRQTTGTTRPTQLPAGCSPRIVNRRPSKGAAGRRSCRVRRRCSAAGNSSSPARRAAGSSAISTSATATPGMPSVAGAAGELGLEILDRPHRRRVDAVQKGEIEGRVVAELEARGVVVERVETRGASRLTRLFSLVQLGDYASFYLALLYGVDPTPARATSPRRSGSSRARSSPSPTT